MVWNPHFSLFHWSIVNILCYLYLFCQCVQWSMSVAASEGQSSACSMAPCKGQQWTGVEKFLLLHFQRLTNILSLPWWQPFLLVLILCVKTCVPGSSPVLVILFQEGNSQMEASSQCPKEILKHKYAGLTSSDGEHAFILDEVSDISRETNYCQSCSS